ncbi:hypothetical protein POM88_054004 [Heracleum sosnowskyi]|uniref:Heat shock protein 70 n=1 Tax=Heracleum sosnowskyi TaxID=360622 RepID=A0AAD8LWK7_9APIA|nr:hypothetical protein POM88_054004 [Heracleum sosnowskyi]
MENYYAAAVGIDLGTTNSCVGVWQHDRVVIIANEHGNRTTPSCVAFTDTDHLVGDSAMNQAALNPSNTIFDRFLKQLDVQQKVVKEFIKFKSTGQANINGMMPTNYGVLSPFFHCFGPSRPNLPKKMRAIFRIPGRQIKAKSQDSQMKLIEQHCMDMKTHIGRFYSET